MTYAELVDAIQDYMVNSEATFVANIPVFVQQAEERIFRSVYLPAFVKNGTVATVNGTPTVTVPSDFIYPVSMTVVSGTTRSYLLKKEPEFLREAFPTTTTTGTPRYYALYNETQFLFGPTPDAIYTLEVAYGYIPTSIVTASTSWLGTNAETCLLYGSLIEAGVFMRLEPEAMKELRQNYDTALALLKNEGNGKDTRDVYRYGQPRTVPQ